MKKILIVLLTLTLGLLGCNAQDEKVLIEGTKERTFFDITKEDLELKTKTQDSFVTYYRNDLCSTCLEFSLLIDKYIELYEAKIYSLDINYIEEKKEAPSIEIFQNGKRKYQLSYDINREEFYSFSALENYMNQKIIVSNLKEIDYRKVDEYIFDDIIYFSYSLCPDCIYFEKNYLLTYLKENNINIIYCPLDEIFLDQAKKEEFMNHYGLSNKGLFGYQNGVVPTFFKYRNGKIENGFIAFNDVFDEEYNEFNELISITLIDSYYKDNPFLNQRFIKSEQYSAKENYRRETLPFYISKFLDFIKS